MGRKTLDDTAHAQTGDIYAMTPKFSVILPVRNEAVQLAKTAAALKVAATGLSAEIIYVLNATNDESASIIKECFGDEARILDLPTPGKTSALQAGDEAATHSLRIYLDSDYKVEPDTLLAVLGPIVSGCADLVAPRIRVNLREVTGLSLRVARVWSEQMNRREDAFMGCTAWSEAGINTRGRWPNVIADDDWARSQIDPARRYIVDTTYVETSPPLDLFSWINVRARWITGTRQLRRMKLETAPVLQQRPRGSLPDLITYYLVRMLAEPVSHFQAWMGIAWARDNSIRRPRNG